jgi:hypothetical protein
VSSRHRYAVEQGMLLQILLEVLSRKVGGQRMAVVNRTSLLVGVEQMTEQTLGPLRERLLFLVGRMRNG